MTAGQSLPGNRNFEEIYKTGSTGDFDIIETIRFAKESDNNFDITFFDPLMFF